MKSWNEIRKNAAAFSKRWKNAYDEKSQAQSFLKEFFAVFGVDAVQVATFEHRVKFSDGSQGYVDCFWQGRILVEMKSRGRDLDAAFAQAMEYVRSLPDASHTPRAIVVSDFARIRFYDLANDCALTEFSLKDLRRYVTLFGVLIGIDGSCEIREQDPVNRRAAERMARLHDAMKAVGYAGHPLEVYLVRILFCLFAEDTGIFKPMQFAQFIQQKTADDGSDLAPQLALLFDTLNREKRLSNLDETVGAFPYVNGGLFAETLPMAAFSPEMRKAIIDCASLDWSKISPAIFGAMFQGVMDGKERHDLGAHYTSEENILKLIRPLFLDALRAEFNSINGRASTQGHRGTETQGNEPSASLRLCVKNAATGKGRRIALEKFHEKIAKLTFLDPACGCGNFLLIAYRELRRLEMDVLEELYKDDSAQFLDISQLCRVSVAQFCGIEIEPFPAEIAKVALWLMDHLCNMEVADRFGQYFVRIPIKASPHIVCGNALRLEWGGLLVESGGVESGGVESGGVNSPTPSPTHTPTFSYIMGNPPFLGFTWMSDGQKADMLALFPKNKNLDFVCGWYKKASDLIQGTQTRCAFVSTNSITQGEQVAPLWRNLNAQIDFAYRTFKWRNEAKGVAAVHCVIIGFSASASRMNSADGTCTTRETCRTLDGKESSCLSCGSYTSQKNTAKRKAHKIIYDGDKVIEAENINGYLMDAPSVVVESRNIALCDVPQMVYGNKPTDGGNLILTPQEKDEFLAVEPQSAQFIRPLLGAEEFLHGKTRYCIWLVDADIALMRKCPRILERVEAVRQFRAASKKAATRKKADLPMLFDEVRQPKEGEYLLFPRHSSENRKYVPIGFISKDVILGDSAQMIPNASLYHFGILTSRMHNAWMRAVAGRLKSDYRYSKDIVYNNFIWPEVGNVANVKMLPVANANTQLETETGIGRAVCPQTAEDGNGALRTTRPTSCAERIYEDGNGALRAARPTDDSNGALRRGKAPQTHPANCAENITAAAQAVLDARAAHPTATLADLYDPLAMPPDLVKAHAHLDALVDKAYGLKPTCTDAERVAHLFKLYDEKMNLQHS